MNGGHGRCHLSRGLLIEEVPFRGPVCALNKQSIHVDAVPRCFGDFLGQVLFENAETVAELVDGLKVLPRIGLQCPRHEAMREEEAGEPVARGVATLKPGSHKFHAVVQISDPGGQGLQAGVSDGLPIGRHLIL